MNNNTKNENPLNATWAVSPSPAKRAMSAPKTEHKNRARHKNDDVKLFPVQRKVANLQQAEQYGWTDKNSPQNFLQDNSLSTLQKTNAPETGVDFHSSWGRTNSLSTINSAEVKGGSNMGGSTSNATKSQLNESAMQSNLNAALKFGIVEKPFEKDKDSTLNYCFSVGTKSKKSMPG